MSDETNIVNDDFLKDIFNDFKEPEKEVEEKTEIDNILLPDDIEEAKIEEEEEIDKDTEEKIEEDIIPEDVSKKRFGVRDTISSLIDNNEWVDMPIKYNDKEYENISDLLEKEKASKELFDLLSLAQKKYREDQIKENYIKVKGKDDSKLKLVNAILDDVDYTDLLEYNKDVIQPLKKIDFQNIQNGDKIAEAFVKQCMIEIDNYHPSSIDSAVESLKKDFKLMDKAEEYQKITIDNFNSEVEKRKEEKTQRETLEKEVLRENIKDLKTFFKDNKIDDKFSNDMVKLRYAKDDNGNYHYENLLKDKLKDKDFTSKFLHFLIDDEDFVKKATTKVKTETSKKFLELVNITPKDKGAKSTQDKGKNLQNFDEDLFEELGLM